MSQDASADRDRERLAFGREVDWEREGRFGTVYFGDSKDGTFPPLPVGQATELLAAGHLDPADRHNDAPPAGELVDWAGRVQRDYREYQLDVGLLGYMVAADRADARIGLQGVLIRSPGPVPERLERSVAERFDPDLLSVDDFHVRIYWD